MDVDEALAEVRHLVADETWVGVVELDVRHLRVWLNERDVLAAEVRALRTERDAALNLLEGYAPELTRRLRDQMTFERARATEGEP